MNSRCGNNAACITHKKCDTNIIVKAAKPEWLKAKSPSGKYFEATKKIIREHSVNTVCEECACPNIGECWNKQHAAFMILGDICTRKCGFCNVKNGTPSAVDVIYK